MVLVAFVAVILLAGEHVSQQGFDGRTTGDPAHATSSLNEESLSYGDAQPQRMMQPDSFIIRPGQSKLTYTQALDLYKNDILQFNQDCQLSTASRSFHLNNEIMIDNRSSKPNTFVVGDALVAIGPYDFAFMILKQKGESVPVNCGDRKNIANLFIQ